MKIRVTFQIWWNLLFILWNLWCIYAGGTSLLYPVAAIFHLFMFLVEVTMQRNEQRRMDRNF